MPSLLQSIICFSIFYSCTDYHLYLILLLCTPSRTNLARHTYLTRSKYALKDIATPRNGQNRYHAMFSCFSHLQLGI